MKPAIVFGSDGSASWAEGFYDSEGNASGFVNGSGFGKYEGQTHSRYEPLDDDDVNGYLTSVGEQNNLDREFNSAEALKQREWQEMMYAEQKAFNSAEALKERLWSAEEAKKSRDWQTEMSNTSYQRAVSDLKAAGLNPILAAARSAGATTGSGGMATGGSAGSISSISGASASSQGSKGNDLASLMASVGSLLGGAGTMLDSIIGIITQFKGKKSNSIGFR